MEYEFEDSDIYFEDISAGREELHLMFDAPTCFFTKRDIKEMAEALGLIVVEAI